MEKLSMDLSDDGNELNLPRDHGNRIIYLEEEPRSRLKSKKERKEEYDQAYNILQETQQRKWMERHGKSKFVQFNDE